MAYLLVVHGDRLTRKNLEAQGAKHREVRSVGSVSEALVAIQKRHPDLIVAGMDGKRREAAELLRSLNSMKIEIPLVVVGSAGTGVYEQALMKMGAQAYLEYPVEQTAFDQTVSKALQKDRDAYGLAPPISTEEQAGNLSDIERNFNRQMKCFAGKNQVYIQSFIVGYNRTTQPRIALKCSLRKEYGEPPNVYHEYIRDVCCGDPSACPAYQKFRAKNSA